MIISSATNTIMISNNQKVLNLTKANYIIWSTFTKCAPSLSPPESWISRRATEHTPTRLRGLPPGTRPIIMSCCSSRSFICQRSPFTISEWRMQEHGNFRRGAHLSTPTDNDCVCIEKSRMLGNWSWANIYGLEILGAEDFIRRAST